MSFNAVQPRLKRVVISAIIGVLCCIYLATMIVDTTTPWYSSFADRFGLILVVAALLGAGILVLCVEVVVDARRSMKDPGSFEDKRNTQLWLWLAAGTLALYLFSRLWGIADPADSWRHTSYHSGLFASLGRNLVEQGWINQCGDVRPPSTGYHYGEPGDCWVYRSGWWSIPTHLMAGAILIGVNPILTQRIIMLVVKLLTCSLVARIVHRSGASRRAVLIASILYLTSAQTGHYGRIFTWQPFSELSILILANLLHDEWLGENSNRVRWFIIYAIGFVLPIIQGHDVAATFCFAGLIHGLRHKTNGIAAWSLLIVCVIGGLVSWFVWSGFVTQVVQGGVSALIENASRRAGWLEHWFSLSHWTRILAFQILMIGPAIILILLSTGRNKTPRFLLTTPANWNPSMMAAAIPISYGVYYGLVFPQAAWVHDYILYVHLAGISMIAGILSERLNDRSLGKVLITGLILNLLILSGMYIERPFSDSIESQTWAAAHSDSEGTIVIENELYDEHLLAWYIGDDVIHIENNELSEVLESLDSGEVQAIILRGESLPYLPAPYDEWCTASRSEFSPYILTPCSS